MFAIPPIFNIEIGILFFFLNKDFINAKMKIGDKGAPSPPFFISFCLKS